VPEGYEVLSAAVTQELSGTGSLVDVVQVTFKSLPHEVVGQVRVPKTAGWREAALALIATEAAELESLFGP